MSTPRLRLAAFVLPVLALAALIGLLSLRTAAAPAYDCAAATGIPQAECEALVALYTATGGENWKWNYGWLQTDAPCNWPGVSCASGRVQHLGLEYNNLVGSIPPEIGNLTALGSLALGRNHLRSLPPEIGHLTSLTVLRLTDNQLSRLPPQIGDLTALDSLRLGYNQLSSLPPEIENLTELDTLRLEYNRFSSLPPVIGNLTGLAYLDVDGNQLSSLPSEMGKLAGLIALHVDGNQLSSLPPEIGALTALRQLYVSDNRLSSLSPEIGNLSALESLSLTGNQLSRLPPEIGNLTSLAWLSLDDNQLGSLPPEVGNLTALVDLYLSDNQLSSLPPEIGSLAALEALFLDENQLTGLPPEIGNLTSLILLHLQSNPLSNLPAEIGNLADLSWLSVNGNPLSGPLPASLTGLSNLIQFTFYDTGWCVPPGDPSVQPWLASIHNLYGTGLVCGQPPGGLSGRVSGASGRPLPGVSVALYRRVPSLYPDRPNTLVDATTTGPGGAYRFGNLGQGIDYWLYFAGGPTTHAPEYYEDARALDAAIAVTATVGGTRTGFDATLDGPRPPLATVTTTGGTVNVDPIDGSVVVIMVGGERADVTVRREVTCTGGLLSPNQVALEMSTGMEYASSYSMAAVGDDMYQATIPAADILRDVDLRVLFSCYSMPGELPVGRISLVTPSGVIRDAQTGRALAGATVTLYQVPGWLPRNGPADTRPDTCESNRSKAPDAPWIQPAPLGLIANPDVPPLRPALARQRTDAAGRYGWGLPKGCWYVKVTAFGYAPQVSPVVGAPPQLTDLDLALTPLVLHRRYPRR